MSVVISTVSSSSPIGRYILDTVVLELVLVFPDIRLRTQSYLIGRVSLKQPSASVPWTIDRRPLACRTFPLSFLYVPDM